MFNICRGWFKSCCALSWRSGFCPLVEMELNWEEFAPATCTANLLYYQGQEITPANREMKLFSFFPPSQISAGQGHVRTVRAWLSDWTLLLDPGTGKGKAGWSKLKQRFRIQNVPLFSPSSSPGPGDLGLQACHGGPEGDQFEVPMLLDNVAYRGLSVTN